MITVKGCFIVLLSLVAPTLLSAQEFGGNPNSIKWKQINNATSRVIFPVGMDSQANRVNNINLLLSKSTTATIGGKQSKWNILLLNQTTIPNAYVRMAPIMSELYMTPGQDNFANGSLRWDDNLIIHENRHIQQLSNFNSGLTNVFSFFLGQEGQLLANGLVIPDYFFEGDAVWQETLVSAQGRGRMPNFYNGMKSLSLGNKKYSWMKLRSGSYKDYTPNHYELGYQLVAYGYAKYGGDFWKKVTTDAVHFKGLFYAFNKAIERHSGVSYKQFQQDALLYFKERALPENKKDTDELAFQQPTQKSNVVDYLFPVYAGNDSVIVTKKSYKELSSFYILANGKEHKLRIKNRVIDDYFSYRNGKIVYASYESDPRWGNRNYSIIQYLDITNNHQTQLTFQSKYFSPDINESSTEIIAVKVNTDGTNNLHRINANSGAVIKILPNENNYFFTQTKYIDDTSAVSAVRNAEGKMCLVKVNLADGSTERITPFSFNVIGNPLVKGDTIYFGAMNKNADKIFAVTMKDQKIFHLTDNTNGLYQPAVNNRGELLFTAFTADGYRLAKLKSISNNWRAATDEDFTNTPDLYTSSALRETGAGILYTLTDTTNTVTDFKKSFRLFNFHSWRPEANDPEYSYHVYSNNLLSTFSNSLTYTYNRSDKSHTLGFYEVFAGWFPVISLGGEHHFNRSLDTAIGKSVQFNSAKLKAGIYIPLSFVGGRTTKNVAFGGGYNLEQLFYRGIGKNIFDNKSVKYTNYFLSFSNVGQQAIQHINPRWAQSFAVSYRDAFTLINSHKFVANSSFYFPGFSTNHSTVINASFQKRDTLPDFFSNTFSYSRGYDALSSRRMYKLGINYHFTLLYPDWGVGNIVFFQRIRANAFYDHTIATARLNGIVTDLKNRSTGGEIYFDTKVWNALPVSFGVRFSHLMDINYRNPGVKNLWEFIVPIGLIPN